MRGHIRRRGKNSWRLKFDAGRDAAGNRKIHTFRGTKREAQVRLAELIASVAQSSYVEPNRITVKEFVRARVDAREAAGAISARTAARYRELMENQIVPHIGTKLLQKLRPLDIDHWHATLRTHGKARGRGGIAVRTIGHAHRVLSKALSDAAANELVVKNVARAKSAPKVPDDEMMIAKDVPGLLANLQQSDRLRLPAMVSLFTGMRLGEVLALRWGRVDLDRAIIRVREALEYTKAHGIHLKQPKSNAGRRDISLPDVLLEALRDYRKAQLELRMKLGAGKLPDDALLFADIDGNPPSPNALSAAWADFAERIGAPEISFHALRHTHASQLIDAGVDIVTISKRLGHAKPDITLRIYAHLFRKDDAKAAEAINEVLKR
jgi:integrase